MVDRKLFVLITLCSVMLMTSHALDVEGLQQLLKNSGLEDKTIGDLKEAVKNFLPLTGNSDASPDGKNIFGNPLEVIIDEEDQTSHTIVSPVEDPMADPTENLTFDDYARFGEKVQHLSEGESVADLLSCDAGDGPEYFRFVPQHVFSAVPGGEQKAFSGACFKATTISAFQKDPSTVTIKFDIAGKDSLLCTQTYWVTAAKHHHMETLFLSKKHSIDFTGLDQDDIDDIMLNGLHVFRFCDGLGDSMVDLFMTLKMFLGGVGLNPDTPVFGSHVPDYMRKANVDFMKKANGWELRERTVNRVDVDEADVHSGDFLGIYRLDGLDPIIMWGSGSRLGHSTLAMRDENDKLWVVESQDGWYWPTHGIQKTPWKDWIDRADNADFHVALMPLSPENRKKFDVQKAWDWFNNTAEGLPYGYHNMVLSWFDLADNHNTPQLIQDEVFPPVFMLLDKIAPAFATRLIGEAMNKRLGTEGLNIAQTVAEGARQGYRWSDLWAMTEEEGWVYSDGMSYVCSCFVIAMYKQGGLFDDLDINSTEFTPRDIYELDFWDHDYKLPQICEESDPDLPFCQLLGHYKVDLTAYNSRKPYAHMNEKCPSIAPDYPRPDDC